MPAAVLEKIDPGTMYNYEFRGDSRSEMTVADWEIDGEAYSFASTLNDSSPVIELR
jgi:hypothetical protein